MKNLLLISLLLIGFISPSFADEPTLVSPEITKLSQIINMLQILDINNVPHHNLVITKDSLAAATQDINKFFNKN